MAISSVPIRARTVPLATALFTLARADDTCGDATHPDIRPRAYPGSSASRGPGIGSGAHRSGSSGRRGPATRSQEASTWIRPYSRVDRVPAKRLELAAAKPGADRRRPHGPVLVG